ncbi:hypothetical protein SKAU_G00326130 [Synaphobranchus kaupii]|uniref:Integrase catalytic domain-containing protein n=1 Tax=Synaphobranchus kaupii TaxID=118154 RepID=A0A9Q1EPR9_SYNKA|nr:hypothetical protein SKAU_G00326130 [Synaphobranchus kaupii]
MHYQNAGKHENAFNKAYESWKQTAKESRSTLKALCSPDDLDKIQSEIKTRYDIVRRQYEPITRNRTTTPDIANKMDACNILTEEILDLVNKRLKTINENYNEQLEKVRVRMALNKAEYGSVFGYTKTETVVSETSEKSNNHSSAASNSSSKRLDAEAELAAKREQAKVMKDIQAQQARFTRMESELKLEEAKMLAEIEQKRANSQIELEEERTKLVQLQADKEVQVAAARVRAYESFGSDNEDDGNHKTDAAHQEIKHAAQLNPKAMSFQPRPASLGITAPEETSSLVQALANSLSINRLPVPEPTVFNCDPIKFVDWKMSFMALIDQKPIPASEKMFYLKTYLTGEALKAVEGFFYRSSDDAYKGAWKVLQERYGNPFIVQRAFRDKLAKWPKIDATDPLALREFADFLQGCAEATPHVKGLAILNDCEENHKLLKKLPEWIVRKWSRIVVDQLDNSGKYPDLAYFTKFLNKEVRIACNPIASPFLMNAKSTDERSSKRARALNTSTRERNSIRETGGTSHSKVKPPCSVCKDETHGIGRCPTFALKTMEDKKAFIHENRLCFGCLRKGHVSKECKRRYTCSICNRRHPTCLHEERGQETTEEMKGNSTSADNSDAEEVHEVTSHASTQHVPATSSIVPVLVSSRQEPEREILTYALLDTQSDSTFILEDLLDDLNVEAQPVKLKLSTMTAIDTVLPTLAPLEAVIGGENEPFAQRTELGWSIIGSSNPHLDRQGSQSFVHRVTVKEIPTPPVTDVLKALESDFIERACEEKYVSQDDVQFIQFLSDNIRHKDGHLEMPLPFKNVNPPSLPNNKRLATIRLQSLKKKLKANEQYYDHYKTFMEEMISRGDAELTPTSTERETAWYLPHHGVYHSKRPGKLRVVFDCSAKFCGVSLNETLLTGPDLINPLVGVLCRFRKENIAIICDVERMFHQFLVTPESRNYLRFLWWEGGDMEKEPQDYRMTVHIFGASSSPGCANFGLKYLARQHESDYPSASAFIEKDFYVDDGLTSIASVEEAKDLIISTQELCKRGGLRLHKFDSNQKAVLECVNPSERASSTETLELKQDVTPTERALGIQWSIENDTLIFNTSAKDQPPTRRGILSVVASLYDPLGLVAPFVLSGKCILQELCRRGTGWDDPLPNDLGPRWEERKIGLQSLKEVVILRCYHPQDFENIVKIELHHFSDASSKGYGACSYIRCKNDRGAVHTSLAMAKARVAPTMVMSIPRLELSAAVVTTRLSVTLKRELEMKIDEEFFWTDSQVVLGYINNDARRFHVFVANRVQLIRENTDPCQWHHVDTAENPADHASRGLQATQISSSNWIQGPTFLWEQEVHTKPNSTTELLIGDPEVKTALTCATRLDDCADILDRLGQISSWTKLLNVIARIKRLGSKQKYRSEVVTITERERATETIIKLVHQKAFHQEVKTLQRGERLPSSDPLFSLDLILHKGLLCVGGRLKKSSLRQELKHPVILPKDSHITKLVLAHCHAKICHQGRGQTQMELRANGFWVISGNKLVAKLIHNCVQCRKLRRPTEEQQMAALPKERVEASGPFTYSGMDCFGPFIIKKARKEYKRYGLVFTCFASRAVHIEMLEDLSTDAFINALRCFISLRGAVRELHCDHGSNFVGARNELREALKQCDTKLLEAFLADKQCDFVFNAPSASHAGGVWERQIRTIRNVLNGTLAQCPGRLDDASLRTLFYEAIAIVNSRPLTIDGINDPKALEPLTPNHLIMMKSKVALPPPGKFVKEDMYATKRWRRVQYLIEQFWGRWRKEYLLNISTRQKWHVPRRNLKTNDIVIIKDDNLPRSQWLLGKVVEVTQESDGLVRRVKIQTGKLNQGHSSKPSIIERPVQKLVLLLESD